MSLEQFANLAQIVASVGVVLSLIFVGLQVRQSTAALQRNEHNSTMEQWTAIRMAIATNRDIAELMTAGIAGDRPLDGADQLRLELMLQQNLGRFSHLGPDAAWSLSQRTFQADRRTTSLHDLENPLRSSLVGGGEKRRLRSRLCPRHRCLARIRLRRPYMWT